MLLQALVTALFSLPPLTQQALVWQDFTPTDSSFATSVPTTPDVSVRYTRTAHGVLPTHSVSSTDTPRRQFFASWTTYPIDPVAGSASVALLDAARNALIQGHDGATVLSIVDDSLGRYPGQTTVFRTAAGHLIQVRFLWGRNRFYQIMAETPDTLADRAAGARFLRSFRVQPRRLI